MIGPRLWGTDLLGGGVAPEERRDVRLAWRSEAEGHGGGKGKGREDGMEGVEAESSSRGVGDLQGMADRALEELFQTRMDDSVPSFGGLKQRPTGILAILLKLLIESSHAEEVPVADVTFQLSRSARVRMADMICSLFAGTLRTKPQRLALLSGEGDMAIATTFALLRLIVHGTGKVRPPVSLLVPLLTPSRQAQESALQALSALARDPHPALIVMCRMDSEQRDRDAWHAPR